MIIVLFDFEILNINLNIFIYQKREKNSIIVKIYINVFLLIIKNQKLIN